MEGKKTADWRRRRCATKLDNQIGFGGLGHLGSDISHRPESANES
jgi:hypothetical protein